ncbi:MAG: hypothetical protein JOY94_21520 [Methylobacteriaceae bacterium]|nr:hypothetical protein [Methylobacteriaceae bacterium]
MNNVSRRAFVQGTVATLAALQPPMRAMAAAQCVSGFLPARLSVDCATRANFQLFRQNSASLGLAGVVSMNHVEGRFGVYEAGSLLLFPWLKPKGQAQRTAWRACVPTSPTEYIQTGPIGGTTLPVDEYFCRMVLQAPWNLFIGFTVDVPYTAGETRLAWFSNTDKLADGKAVGIDWTSANLNEAWFAGSRWIPADDTCSGKGWRQVIADGLDQASAAVC